MGAMGWYGNNSVYSPSPETLGWPECLKLL